MELQPEQRKNDVEMVLLRRDLEELTEKVDALTSQVHDLVAAWNTATYIVAFVKWLAGLAAAIGIIIAAVKGFGK
jgi:hypothetical protein